ncbi:MAG TPA: extracellular solute-binding protein [Pseudolabrys sp.]|nr:extracellular solute-binding protein [Pseudolabrys sp.]
MKQPALLSIANVVEMDRRALLLGSAAAGTLAWLGDGPAVAEDKPVTAIMPGPFIPDSVRPLIEKKANTKVENAPYVSPTDTLAKLLAPGGTSRYDLMISVTPFVRGPILGAKSGDEKVAPLNMSLIPNASKVMDLFKPDIVTRDGKTYMLPVIWGYDSVIYNADKIPPADPLTQSWGVLFDDKYAGRVAWRDDAQMMIMAAGLHLGISDPASMSAADLKKVTAFLTQKKKNVRTMWSTFAAAVNLMSSGEVWAMYGWIPMRAALQKRGMNVTNNWPSESLLIWSQGAFIPKDSPNAKASHAVINAYLDNEVGKTLVADTNYPTTSSEISGAFSPEERKKLGLDIVERKVKVYPLKFPVAMDQWLEAWNTVKSA